MDGITSSVGNICGAVHDTTEDFRSATSCSISHAPLLPLWPLAKALCEETRATTIEVELFLSRFLF